MKGRRGSGSVLLPNSSKKLMYGCPTRGGKFTPAEANIDCHFKWYFTELKLPPMEVCHQYLQKYCNERGRTARDIYDKVKGQILWVQKQRAALDLIHKYT